MYKFIQFAPTFKEKCKRNNADDYQTQRNAKTGTESETNTGGEDTRGFVCLRVYWLFVVDCYSSRLV